MAKQPGKNKREEIGVLKRTKRSGLYVPNSNNSGIVKAPKAQQKVFKKEIKSQIKAKRRG